MGGEKKGGGKSKPQQKKKVPSQSALNKRQKDIGGGKRDRHERISGEVDPAVWQHD